MAGGHIGDLTIRVRPDSAGFRRDLGRQLNKAIREATGILKELKVAPRMDTTAFKKDMKDLKDIVKDEKVSVSVEADYEDAIRGVHDFKRELANERVEIKVDADISFMQSAAQLSEFFHPSIWISRIAGIGTFRHILVQRIVAPIVLRFRQIRLIDCGIIEHR